MEENLITLLKKTEQEIKDVRKKHDSEQAKQKIRDKMSDESRSFSDYKKQLDNLANSLKILQEVISKLLNKK